MVYIINLWFLSILVGYYSQVSFNFKVLLQTAKISENIRRDWVTKLVQSIVVKRVFLCKKMEFKNFFPITFF